MFWLENFTLIMRSNIQTLRECVEDPERMLHQLLVDMQDELDRTRHCVAGAIADEILLKNKVDQARQDSADWDERAAAALKRGDQSSARAALEQKVLTADRAVQLAEEHEKQTTQTGRLQQSLKDLEDKIRQARQKQTLLLARLARAESGARINQALDRTNRGSAFAQFGRLERRVERAEAISEAYDRMDGKDPQAEELERKLREADQRERVAREFEELQKRTEAGGS